jgi:hypothetical protein
LIIRFIVNLQIVITRKYSVIANPHTLHFITARAKSSHSAVFSQAVAQIFPLLPCSRLTDSRLSHSRLIHSQSYEYFNSGGVLPVSSSWRQLP